MCTAFSLVGMVRMLLLLCNAALKHRFPLHQPVTGDWISSIFHRFYIQPCFLPRQESVEFAAERQLLDVSHDAAVWVGMTKQLVMSVSSRYWEARVMLCILCLREADLIHVWVGHESLGRFWESDADYLFLTRMTFTPLVTPTPNTKKVDL